MTPAQSKSTSASKIGNEAIREELSRMLETPIFAQSDRLVRFLNFTVETTLAGQGETLKEYVIGTEVYDRKPPYHPSVDSIVRSEARRLRKKLRQYYESVGKDDPIFIYYRTGSYIPAFRRQATADHRCETRLRALEELLTEGLMTEAADLSSDEGKFNVQIIFEGTVRVLRSGAKFSSTGARPGKIISKRHSIRKIFSMSAKAGC